MTITRRRWLAFGVATVAAGLAAACSQASAPTTPTPVPSTPLKPSAMTEVNQLMSWFAESSHGGFYAAWKNGDYEKQNLKMTIQQGGPQISAIPLVTSGKVTFAMTGGVDSVLLAREQGLPVVMIFATFQINEQGLMFHNSHPLNDFADLNGRKVYVSPNAAFWLYLSRKYKLDQVDQLNYNGQLPLFLNDETVVFQCYIGEEPQAARRAGADPGYLLIADSGYNPYGDVVVTTEQVVKDRPEVVHAYVTASIAGWKAYLQDPAPTLTVLKEANKDYDLELGALAAGVEKPLILGNATDPQKKMLGRITDERVKTAYEQLREAGVLKQDQDYKAAFTTRFLDAASKA